MRWLGTRWNNSGWNDRGRLQDRATRRDFHHGNTPCVQHDEPVAVSAAQHPGILSQYGADVVDNLGCGARIGILVRDIHAVAASQPDTKHDAFHASEH